MQPTTKACPHCGFQTSARFRNCPSCKSPLAAPKNHSKAILVAGSFALLPLIVGLKILDQRVFNWLDVRYIYSDEALTDIEVTNNSFSTKYDVKFQTRVMQISYSRNLLDQEPHRDYLWTWHLITKGNVKEWRPNSNIGIRIGASINNLGYDTIEIQYRDQPNGSVQTSIIR
jgi:hypothetical protein